MPGFNINTTGDGPLNTAEPRRTHRWVFATLGRGQGGSFSRAELLVLKSASRPKVKFVEAKMDHNQETSYYAGKTEWDPIELTWYDMEQAPDTSLGVYVWLETVSQISTANVGHPFTYKQQAQLVMLSGMDAPNETWDLYGCWPQDVDWKGLDYTTSDIQTCVAKMRFDRAQRSCTNTAGILGTVPDCSAAGITSSGAAIAIGAGVAAAVGS